MISLERRGGRPVRIGHRGAAALAPENTIRSFRAALETGVDLIEFDVLDLVGGELVVAHSDDLAEVSHGAARGKVRERSLENLKAVCPELPTLDEALAFFAHDAIDTGLHLDLKVHGRGAAIASALEQFGLAERSFVSTSHFRTLRTLSQTDPRLRVGVTFPPAMPGISESGRGAPIVRAGLGVLRRITSFAVSPILSQARASVLVVHHALADPGVVRRAHARGAAVVAWTVDDPRDLARVDAAGVDAVVSNDPRIFVSTLET